MARLKDGMVINTRAVKVDGTLLHLQWQIGEASRPQQKMVVAADNGDKDENSVDDVDDDILDVHDVTFDGIKLKKRMYNYMYSVKICKYVYTLHNESESERETRDKERERERKGLIPTTQDEGVHQLFL